METMNATDAKREFGKVLLKAQKEPVAIIKNGKPVAVMISTEDFETYVSLNEQHFIAELQKGLDDVHAGRVTDGEEVIRILRKKIKDGSI